MELRGDTVEAHTFVVMPNHFHAIIGLKNPETLTVPEPKIQHFHDYSFKKTLGSIVRGFKASVTSRLGYSVWQRNYYEHIIRSERSLLNIAEYIELNPVKWENDRFYK